MNGNQYRRIFSWGTPGGTPHIQVFLSEDNVPASNKDRFNFRITDDSGNGTGISTGGVLASSYNNLWVPYHLSHNSANNYTVLRMWRRDIDTGYAAVDVSTNLGTINPSTSLFVGATSDNLNTRRLIGDHGDFAIFLGEYWEANGAQWSSWIRGVRPYRFKGLNLWVPMPNETTVGKDWGPNQESVTTANITAIESNPPQSLILPNSFMRQSSPEITSNAPTTHNESVTSNLTLNQAASIENLEQSVTSNLSLTQNAAVAAERPRSVSSILSLVDQAARVKLLSANNTLNFYTWNLVLQTPLDHLPFTSTLNFTQLAFTLSTLQASDTLSLTQNVTVKSPFKESVSSYLGLTQTLPTPFRLWVDQTLNFIWPSVSTSRVECH
jgi:hypothetical protein